MLLRIIGASCILIVCGGFGFMVAENQVKEMRTLRQMMVILDYMESELLFQLPPLQNLCHHVAGETNGVLARVFTLFAKELEKQTFPNTTACMQTVIKKVKDIPDATKFVLLQLGSQLGKFDLQGQVKGLESIRQICHRKLKALDHNKDARIRGYKTLGLCAGAALVILFI